MCKVWLEEKRAKHPEDLFFCGGKTTQFMGGLVRGIVNEILSKFFGRKLRFLYFCFKNEK